MRTECDILDRAQKLGAETDLDIGTPRGTRRVAAAMSGGVDSAVAAALVKRAGYETIGVTLQLYESEARTSRPGACCAGRDIADARTAAARLDIPHYVLDMTDRFREAVIDDFADTYLAGATPVPCIRCNQSVKFSDLMGVARDLGCQALVTGHYVRRCVGATGPALAPARERARDQSWFLFATTREQLEFLRFPLGGMNKADVRALAARFELGIADKPDSQDICFVTGDYAQTLLRLRPGAAEPGPIVHEDGRVLGSHRGVIHYTVGQRRGLRVGGGEPLYVLQLDAARREVRVGPREALLIRSLTLGETNWLGADTLDAACHGELAIGARVRSSRPPAAARLRMFGDRPGLVFDRGEVGVAPGQACVLQDGNDRILGGGFIVETGRGETPGAAARANAQPVAARRSGLPADGSGVPDPSASSVA